MKLFFSPVVRGTSLLVGALLALAAAPTRGADKAVADDAFPNFESYIKISGQAPSVTGDVSSFQTRTQTQHNGGAGIEDYHYAKEASKDTTVQFDGHALVGTEDYLAQFRINKNEVGSVDFGYKRFRTFYDGVGGFFPTSSQWMPLTQRLLFLDRGNLWVSATLALPNAPVFSFRYSNETRNGQKDSTIWGDSDFTGMPNNNPPISQVRKFMPSYINIGERTEKLELSMKHTLGKTSFQVTLLGEDIKNLDTLYTTRFPNEVKPYPAPASTVLLPALNMNNQVIAQTGNGTASRATSFLATTETPFNDKLKLNTGFSYQLLHSDYSGDRSIITSTATTATGVIVGSGLSAATGVVPVQTYQYQSIAGGSHIKEFKFNAALTYAATKDISLKLAVKREQEYVLGAGTYTVVAASGTPATTTASTPRFEWSNITQNATTPEAEIRFTGIKNLALYANASKRCLSGTEYDSSAYNPLTAAAGTLVASNVSEDHGNYTVGANWRQSMLLTLRAELFSKNHQNESTGFGTRLGDYYLLDNRFTGVKLTAIVKANEALSFTTRYLNQAGKMKVTGFLPTFPAYDSCDAKNQSIGETIDWTPATSFYAQANVNLVYNNINTVYPNAGIAPASGTSQAWDVNMVLQDSKNNYLTTTLLLGAVMTKTDDLQLQWNYYRADDGNTALAVRTMPYGVVAKDVAVTVGLKHKFSDKMVGNAKLGYFDSTNGTTGGLTNFHGPIGYVSIEYGL